MRTRPKSQKLREVSMPRRPFGAGEMALEGSPRAIRFAVRVDVQHDSRDLAPVGTFQDRRRQNWGVEWGSLFLSLSHPPCGPRTARTSVPRFPLLYEIWVGQTLRRPTPGNQQSTISHRCEATIDTAEWAVGLQANRVTSVVGLTPYWLNGRDHCSG